MKSSASLHLPARKHGIASTTLRCAARKPTPSGYITPDGLQPSQTAIPWITKINSGEDGNNIPISFYSCKVVISGFMLHFLYAIDMK